MSNDVSLQDLFGDVISSYSRAQAIADGELVDVSTVAREAGFRQPTAMTRAAYALCVELSPAAKRALNDERGRLWDVLWMAVNAARRNSGKSEIVYEMRCVTKSTRPSRVFLKLTVGPGDDGSAVFTIMLPEED